MFKRMGIVKLEFALCLSLILALCPCVKAGAVALPMPILPYIPPETGQVLDYLLNANGLTAPDIEGEQNKLDAYLDLYRRALGAGWETAWNETLDAIENGKLSGKMEFSSGVVSALGSAMAYGLQNGFTGEETQLPNDALTYEYMNGKMYAVYNQNSNSSGLGKLINYWKANPSYKLITSTAGSSTQFFYYLGADVYEASGTAYIYGARYTFTNTADVSSGIITYNWSSTIGEPYNTRYWGTLQEFLYTSTIYSIEAQTAEIGQAVTAGTIRALSAYTALNADGSIDVTKPLVVPMPLVDVVPATTVEDLTRVQDAHGVAPAVAGEDVASIVQGLQTAQSDVMDYNLSLANYFPFCIPFDLGNLVSRLVADPVAPHFSWTFKNVDGTDIVEEISLEWLDPVMDVVRAGELLLAGIGLALLTPLVIKW